MKTKNILYWIFTSLFAFLMLGSAIPDILSSPVAVKGMHEGLGYPIYFVPFIGVAKTLGVAAILLPGNARLKEWAYAGLTFDLIGATYSLMSLDASPANWIFMVLPLALAVTSYLLYHRRRRAILAGNAEKSTLSVRADRTNAAMA